VDIAALFDLTGRRALVTGGSRGIGRMIAEGFVAAGAEVVISARSDADCAATAAELGGRCTAIPGDISTVTGAQALADAVSAGGPLDILVNNAGAAWNAPLGEFPEAGWDRAMDLNVKSPFFLTQALLPALEAAGGPDRPAKVIMIASIDGLKNNPWETYSYHASKAAVMSLTRRLAAQLAPRHVVVTAIAPGAFPSKMNRAARDLPDVVSQGVPVGRVGNAMDMAGAAIYLASRAGDYVVGETLVVDGGVVHASVGAGADPKGAG
jgi:NAD(P)-dependent dehydrogenase (short-subunit alcohol dehydrogenase family)